MFRHSVFNEETFIPVAFLIYDGKFQKVHERFFKQLLEQIPNLGRKNLKIVRDREVGIQCYPEGVSPGSYPSLL